MIPDAFGFHALVLASALLAADASHAAETRAASDGPAPGVLEHHNDAARSGLYVVPSLTWERAARLRRDPAFRAAVAGAVYAQPLYWPSPDGKALLLVATEENLVYALDAETGAVVWKKSLGAPAPRSSLRCGNIDPLGVTGTPVIDPRTQALYLDAMVRANPGSAPKHLVFALSLRDGSVQSGWPIDVEAALRANGKSFDSSVQNQRGALTIVADNVYVPYGGHFGDCGDYRGWVIGISLRSPHAVRSWATRARGGGVWAPGGISADARALYVATGNTIGTATWNDGEAVIRLDLDLSFSGRPGDFFAPSDWQRLDAADADLGATQPLLLTVPGATPSELVLGLGKDGKAYLLDRNHLGGVGGSVVVKKVSSEPIQTAPARFNVGKEVFVPFQGRGIECPSTAGDLTVLRVGVGAPPTLRVAWCAMERGRGSPIVTTTDGKSDPIVWAVGAEGDNRLHGFRGDTGAVVFSGGGASDVMSEVRRFQTLIAGGGRLYVAADQQIYAFVF